MWAPHTTFYVSRKGGEPLTPSWLRREKLPSHLSIEKEEREAIVQKQLPLPSPKTEIMTLPSAGTVG